MLILDQAEIYYLNWTGRIVPQFTPPTYSMTKQYARKVWNRYNDETWHRIINQQLKNQFMINKSIAIDSWGLYELVETEKIGLIERFDNVYVSHISIIELHKELSRTNNHKIRELQKLLKNSSNIHIWSAGFKAQIEVRNVAAYCEPAATLALGVEKNCLAVLGAPTMNKSWIDHFSNKIIRVNELEMLVE